MLAVGPGMLLPGYAGDLVFANKTVPLQVTADGAGRTRVSWEISGFAADVTRFWDAVHANGVARGQTLANLLDIRPHPVGEPTAASLPATINPLGFLIANFLRSNCFLIRIDAAALTVNGLTMQPLQLLRRIVPPHTMMIILIELPPFYDGDGVAGQPSEALTRYTGLQPFADTTLVQAEDANALVIRNLDGCG